MHTKIEWVAFNTSRPKEAFNCHHGNKQKSKSKRNENTVWLLVPNWYQFVDHKNLLTNSIRNLIVFFKLYCVCAWFFLAVDLFEETAYKLKNTLLLVISWMYWKFLAGTKAKVTVCWRCVLYIVMNQNFLMK